VLATPRPSDPLFSALFKRDTKPKPGQANSSGPVVPTAVITPVQPRLSYFPQQVHLLILVVVAQLFGLPYPDVEVPPFLRQALAVIETNGACLVQAVMGKLMCSRSQKLLLRWRILSKMRICPLTGLPSKVCLPPRLCWLLFAFINYVSFFVVLM
jgi:hypothetical protein